MTAKKEFEGIKRPPLLPCSLTSFDVLLGRGTGPIKHPGNVRYRCIVEKHVQQYFREEAPTSQNDIDTLDVPFRSLAYKVIREVKEGDGRFLQLSNEVDGDKHTTSLEEVSISKTILKVMHALRHQVKLERKADEQRLWAAPRSGDAALSSTSERPRQVSISSDDSTSREVSSSSSVSSNGVGEEANKSSSQATDMHNTLSNAALLSRSSSALSTRRCPPLAPASLLCCDDSSRTTISCTATALETAKPTKTASLNKEEDLRAREQIMLLREAALTYASSFQVAERRRQEHPVWLRRDLVLAMHHCRRRHEQDLLLLRQQVKHQILLGSVSSRSNWCYLRDGRETTTR